MGNRREIRNPLSPRVLWSQLTFALVEGRWDLLWPEAEPKAKVAKVDPVARRLEFVDGSFIEVHRDPYGSVAVFDGNFNGKLLDRLEERMRQLYESYTLLPPTRGGKIGPPPVR